jgi:hypothetical protein
MLWKALREVEQYLRAALLHAWACENQAFRRVRKATQAFRVAGCVNSVQQAKSFEVVYAYLAIKSHYDQVASELDCPHYSRKAKLPDYLRFLIVPNCHIIWLEIAARLTSAECKNVRSVKHCHNSKAAAVW